MEEALAIKASFSRRQFAEFLSEGMGGEKGMADKLVSTYQLAPEGSATRKGILEMALNTLFEANNETEAMAQMSQEELKAEAENILAELDGTSDGAGK